MLLGSRGSRWRCLLVWMTGTSSLATAACLVCVTGRPAGEDRSSLGSLPLDRALSDLAGCALLGCLAWAWLALTAAVAEAWRRGTGLGPPSCRPRGVVRRVVLAACGVALVSAGASPDAWARPHGAGLLAGLPLPERAVAPRHSPGPAPTRTVDRTADRTVVRTVVVRPGDSLWAIASRDLPTGASDADVTARWQAIYAANRAVIGPDPDLVRPGQRLLLPRKEPS